jgi:hypothetical protein
MRISLFKRLVRLSGVESFTSCVLVFPVKFQISETAGRKERRGSGYGYYVEDTMLA